MSTTNECNLEIEGDVIIDRDLINDAGYDRLFRLIQLLTKKNNYLEGLLAKTKEKYIPETSIDTKSDKVADSTGGGVNTPNTPKLIDFIFTGGEERKPTKINKAEIKTGDLRKKILGFKFTNLILGYSMFITNIKGGGNIVRFEGVFPGPGNRLKQVKTYFNFEKEDLSSMVLNLNGKYYTFNFNGKNIETSGEREDLEADLKGDLKGDLEEDLEKRLEKILKYFCPLLERGEDFEDVLKRKINADNLALQEYESGGPEESRKDDYLAIIYSDFFSKNKKGNDKALAEPYIQIKKLRKKIKRKKMPELLKKYEDNINLNNKLIEAQGNNSKIKYTIYTEVIQELYSYLCINEKYIQNIINMNLDYGIKKGEGNNTIQKDIIRLYTKPLFFNEDEWNDFRGNVDNNKYYIEKSPAREEDTIEYIKNILDTDEGLGTYETNIKEIFTDLDNRYKGEKEGEWDKYVEGSDPAPVLAEEPDPPSENKSEFIIIYLAKKIADEWIQKFSGNNIPLLHIIDGEKDEIDPNSELEKQLGLLLEETPPEDPADPTFWEKTNTIDEGREADYNEDDKKELELGNLCIDDKLSDDKEECEKIFDNQDELNNVYKKAYNMYRNHLIKQLYKNLSRVDQKDEIIDKLLKLIFALKGLVGEDDSSISNEYEEIKGEDKGKIKDLEEKEEQGVRNKTVIDRKINADTLREVIEGQGLSDGAETEIITLAQEYLKAEMEWRDQLGFWDSLSRQLQETKGKNEQPLTKEDIIVFSKYLNNQQKILKELSQKMSDKRSEINNYEDIKDQVFQFIEEMRIEIVQERKEVKKS